MQRTFNDLYQERQTAQSFFVLWMFVESALGITKEYILLITQGDSMQNSILDPKIVALAGLLFTAPFMILNAIVGNRIEAFFSLIRPGIHKDPFEYILLFIYSSFCSLSRLALSLPFAQCFKRELKENGNSTL